MDYAVHQRQTSLRAILASSTTDVKTLDDPRIGTIIRAILAKSTANDAKTARRVADLLHQALMKSQSDAELAMERLEQLRLILQQNMGPSNLVDALQMLGFLDDLPDVQTDAMSLFEQPADSAKLDELKRDGIKHDPWWYADDDEDRHSGDDDDSLKERGVSPNVSGGIHGNGTNRSSDENTTDRNRSMFADPGQLESMTDSGRRLSFKLRTISWAMKHRLHLIYLMLGTCLIVASVGFMQAPRMQPGFGQRNHNVGHDVGRRNSENAAWLVLRKFRCLQSTGLAVRCGPLEHSHGPRA